MYVVMLCHDVVLCVCPSFLNKEVSDQGKEEVPPPPPKTQLFLLSQTY